MGPGRAVRFLQKAAGCGVDGDFGSQTEKAVQACRPGDLIASYCATREAYYRELVRRNASLGVFLKGWLNRLNALRHEVGLAGFEAAPRGGVDEAGARRIPDIGEDTAYDF
jgi:lysozyme family protein